MLKNYRNDSNNDPGIGFENLGLAEHLGCIAKHCRCCIVLDTVLNGSLMQICSEGGTSQNIILLHVRIITSRNE